MIQFIQLVDSTAVIAPNYNGLIDLRLAIAASSRSRLRKTSKTLIKDVPISQETANPIFNFDQKFVDRLQEITSLELGSAVPFISLKAVDSMGKVLHDFNKELFFKPIDFSKINSTTRYSDRPIASLIDLKIKTDQGSGYIYFQDVTFTIKIHKPDVSLNNTLLALLFPGLPMELQYGWKNALAKSDSPLNDIENLRFALKTYNINYTQDGQIDLTINGTAFSERFNNTYLGDNGDKIEELKKADGTGIKELLNKRELFDDELRKGGLSSVCSSILSYKQYFENQRLNPDTSANDMTVISTSLTDYETVLEVVRGKIRDNFDTMIRGLAKWNAPGNIHQGKAGKKQKFPTGQITVHDLISTLCSKTLSAFQEINGGTEIRFVYGLFHDEVGKSKGTFSGTPISDFPIDIERFQKHVNDRVADGKEVLTLEGFFNLLITDFFHDTGYWKDIDSATDSGIRIPHMYLAVNNYVVKGSKDKTIMDVALIDINRDIPITSTIIADLIKKKDGKATSKEFEDMVKSKAKNVPVIRLGHGNSFIRELSMQNVTDAYIQAALIKKMADSSSTYTRSWIPPVFQNGLGSKETKTPLQLPLQGSATVLGSVHWKPFRSFLLLSGVFVIDGIYKILSVEHTLNNQGFSTTITFMYH